MKDIFVQHPALKDRFIRKDLAEDFFRIKCIGIQRIPMCEEDLSFGYFQVEETRDFGSSPTLERATYKAREYTHSHLYHVTQTKTGIDDFRPRTIYIYDRFDNLVMSGQAHKGRGSIQWLMPVTSYQVKHVQETIDKLQKEAAYQRYCEDREGARSLDAKVSVLKGFITDSSYRSYVTKFLLNNWLKLNTQSYQEVYSLIV